MSVYDRPEREIFLINLRQGQLFDLELFIKSTALDVRKFPCLSMRDCVIWLKVDDVETYLAKFGSARNIERIQAFAMMTFDGKKMAFFLIQMDCPWKYM